MTTTTTCMLYTAHSDLHYHIPQDMTCMLFIAHSDLHYHLPQDMTCMPYIAHSDLYYHIPQDMTCMPYIAHSDPHYHVPGDMTATTTCMAARSRLSRANIQCGLMFCCRNVSLACKMSAMLCRFTLHK